MKKSKLKNIIKETFLEELFKYNKEEYDLNIKEGLIKSASVSKAASILKKRFPSWSVKYDKGDSFFTITITNPIGDILPIHLLINNIGYIISHMKIQGRTKTEEAFTINDAYNKKIFDNCDNNLNIDSMIIRCEAKYDQKVTDIPDVMYHVTPAQSWVSIKTKGLVPKSRSKKSFHPDRVYLTFTQQDAIKLCYQFQQNIGLQEWVLLEIYTGSISYLDLYYDPNYKNKGYYTLNNIHPLAMKKIKDIVI